MYSGGENAGLFGSYTLQKQKRQAQCYSLTHSLTNSPPQSLDARKHSFVFNITLKPRCTGRTSRTVLLHSVTGLSTTYVHDLNFGTHTNISVCVCVLCVCCVCCVCVLCVLCVCVCVCVCCAYTQSRHREKHGIDINLRNVAGFWCAEIRTL